MAITYQIDRAAGIVFTTSAGDITLDDIAEHCRRLRSDTAFSPLFSELLDYTGTSPALSLEEMRHVADSLDPYSGEARRAIVASSDLNYGVARMFGAVLAGDTVAVFRSMDEALAWLRPDATAAEHRTS